ncbi:DUF3099 domain-containing protein [Chryseoglobus frigidaquae]|nr:DUF3099 domain-containing protein [Microcella frigidaquae]NHN43810.1 DUF3099 domain-containing protein [Microcella frigidaquae]
MRNVAGYHRDVSKPQSHAITSLPTSPDEERKARMVKYSVAMAVRMVCIMACFVTPGWWLLIPAFGAVVLPYVAVVAANTVVNSAGRAVERPGALLPVGEDRA